MWNSLPLWFSSTQKSFTVLRVRKNSVRKHHNQLSLQKQTRAFARSSHERDCVLLPQNQNITSLSRNTYIFWSALSRSFKGKGFTNLLKLLSVVYLKLNEGRCTCVLTLEYFQVKELLCAFLKLLSLTSKFRLLFGSIFVLPWVLLWFTFLSKIYLQKILLNTVKAMLFDVFWCIGICNFMLVKYSKILKHHNYPKYHN